jgi:hypothetical protein
VSSLKILKQRWFRFLVRMSATGWRLRPLSLDLEGVGLGYRLVLRKAAQCPASIHQNIGRVLTYVLTKTEVCLFLDINESCLCPEDVKVEKVKSWWTFWIIHGLMMKDSVYLYSWKLVTVLIKTLIRNQRAKLAAWQLIQNLLTTQKLPKNGKKRNEWPG